MDTDPSIPLAPSLHPAAVYRIPDLDTLDAIYSGAVPGFIYARDGHPNAAELNAAVVAMEGAAWGTVTGSGMAALSAGLLGLLSAGDRVLASDKLYGRTTKLLKHEFARLGVTTTFVDVNDLDAVQQELSSGSYRVLMAETISNPLCRVADLPDLAAVAHAYGCRLFVDNTFATPLLCRPLDLGADLVMESLTKVIGGHSDLTLGWVGGNDPELTERVTGGVPTWGLAADPFDCWLALRGLPTLELRATTAHRNALAVADWLADRSEVSRVIYPGRPDHPDHALAARQFPTGFGTMLCFELADRDAVNRFLRAAGDAIPFAPSLGHATTTCSHPDTTSHRFEPAEAKRVAGITPGLVRLSVGCENRAKTLKGLAAGLDGV